MDLLEKFAAVEICADNRITETDRQFFQQQQKIYQDAVEGFYQIAALWTDMCANQKAALSFPEDYDNKWRKKYLESRCWPEITVQEIVKHIFMLHREFISTLTEHLNTTYHLSLDTYDVAASLLPQEPSFEETVDAVDWDEFPLTVLRYDDAVDLILSWFNGRTFEEQAPYELVEQCHAAAWDRESHEANFEQKKTLVKFFSGACGYGHHRGYEQWYVNDSMKPVLKGLARFETGAFDRYPDEIASLLSERGRLWYDLWEIEDCKKLERIKLYKNGRMDIRFTSEGYARQFVAEYLGTVE